MKRTHTKVFGEDENRRKSIPKNIEENTTEEKEGEAKNIIEEDRYTCIVSVQVYSSLLPPFPPV
jgi:hypothetical protein